MFDVGNYRVYFKHYPEEWGALKITEVTILPYRGKTACYIEDKDESNKIDVLVGFSYCSMVDIFDKAKGRKVALARAREGQDKEFRTAVWKKYLETTSRL